MPAEDFNSRDDATLRFYADKAETYTASGPGGVSRHLHPFLAKLRPGARILELGCGGGRDCEAMMTAGFDVDPTDGSPAIARQAEQRLGRPVRVMCFDELNNTDAYDAVWASASLLHVPRPSLPHILGLIFKALRPGGLHFASYKAGGLEGRDSHGRYFNYFTKTELTELYREAAPWELTEIADYVGGNYQGAQGPWLAITVQKLR